MLLRDHPNAVLCFGSTFQVLHRGRVIARVFFNRDAAHQYLAGLFSFGSDAQRAANQGEAA